MKRILILIAAVTAAFTLSAAPASAARATVITIAVTPQAPGVYDIDVDSNNNLPGAPQIVTSSGTPAVCSVVRDRVEVLSPGTCTVVADQARTWFYSAGHAEYSFTV